MNEQHEHYEQLLMKAVDGLLGADERRDFNQHLESCASCRAEYLDFVAIKENTNMLAKRILAEAAIEPPAGQRRTVVALGTALLVVAVLLLVGYGLYVLYFVAEAPLVVELAVGLGAAGSLVFLFHALRVAWRGRHLDPYKEIEQ